MNQFPLDSLHLDGLRPLDAILDNKLHPLAGLQIAETFPDNVREVDEHVLLPVAIW